MKSSKKKVIIWLASILGALIVIVSVGGYFAINYAADKVLDSMMEEAKAPVELASPSVSDISPSSSASPSPSASPTSDSEVSSTSDTTEREGEQPGNTSTEGQVKPSGSKEPVSSNTSAQQSPSPTYQADISVDKAENVKENISFSEKTKVMTVMLKRLSVDDIKTLQQLANGGLSVEKKREAKAIILEKLTEEEYDELIKIAKKYGLSQGKSYDDSQKEELEK